MYKNLFQISKKIIISISIIALLIFLIRDFNHFSENRPQEDNFDFQVFGNSYVPDEIIIQKANNDQNYNNIYDVLIENLKIIEGSNNQKIILVEENPPIFHDNKNIYISYNQYIDFNQDLKQKDKLFSTHIMIKDETEYSQAIKNIESFTNYLNNNHNELYAGLESVVYDTDKFLNLNIQGCRIKLMKIKHSFSSLKLQEFKDKFYNLESFINNEEKNIAEIKEIDLRWDNEGYIIWEDKF